MSTNFDPIGQKAEQLAPKAATNGTSNSEAAPVDDDDERIVEEIESLCMNCHENVCCPQPYPPLSHGANPTIRAQPASF